MEKIIYLVWRDPALAAEAFAEQLLRALPGAAREAGAHHLQVNLADAAVAPAKALKQVKLKPQFEALVSVWVDSAIAHLRAPVDAALAATGQRAEPYLVTESEPLPNRKHPATPGKRTEGFAQIAVLRRPEKLAYAQWLDAWHNHHTKVAMETQSTFQYVQNVVVRPLAATAPPIDAIVEECFPPAAMTDYKVFFDAPGDEPKMKKNLQRMMESVTRFIEHGSLDIVPTSQYRLY